MHCVSQRHVRGRTGRDHVHQLRGWAVQRGGGGGERGRLLAVRSWFHERSAEQRLQCVSQRHLRQGRRFTGVHELRGREIRHGEGGGG